jgi:hypothetical protein
MTKQQMLNNPYAVIPLNKVEGVGRYLNSSTYNKLGFSFNPELENKYYQETPWYTQLGNATGQFFGQAGAAFDAQMSKLEQIKETFGTTDGDYLKDAFQASEDLREKYPVFKSANETYGILGYVPFNGDSFSKWSNFVPNLGFTAGTLAGVFVENAIATAIIETTTGGTGTPLVAGKWIKGLYEGIKDIKNAFNIKKMASFANLGKGLYETEKVLGTAGNLFRGVEAFKAGKSLNGALHSMYGGYQLYSAAAGEALIENANSVGEVMKDFKDHFIEENGRDPNSTELAKMQESAEGLILPSSWGNIGILMASNGLQELNAFKAGKALSTLAVTGSKTIGKEVGKRVIFDKSTGLYREALANEIRKSALKSFGRFGLNVLSEGLEESAQGVVAESTKNYFKAKYYDKPISWTDALGQGFAYASSDQGMEEFYAGIVTGGLFSGGGKALNQYQLRKDQKKSFEKTGKTISDLAKDEVQTLNDDVISILKYNMATSQSSENLKVQTVIQKEMMDAYAKGDKEAGDAYRAQGLFKAMFAAKAYGKDEELLKHYKTLNGLERSDLAKYLNIEESQLSSAEDFEETLKDLEDASSAVDLAAKKLPNPVRKPAVSDPKYAKMTPEEMKEEYLKDSVRFEAWQGAQELLAGQYFMANKARKKYKDTKLNLEATNIPMDLLAAIMSQTETPSNFSKKLFLKSEQLKELDKNIEAFKKENNKKEVKNLKQVREDLLSEIEVIKGKITKPFDRKNDAEVNYLMELGKKIEAATLSMQVLEENDKKESPEYKKYKEKIDSLQEEYGIVSSDYLTREEKIKALNELRPEDQKFIFNKEEFLGTNGLSSIDDVIGAYSFLGKLKKDIDYSEEIIGSLDTNEKMTEHARLTLERIYISRKNLFKNLEEGNTVEDGFTPFQEVKEEVKEEKKTPKESKKKETPKPKIELGATVSYKNKEYTTKSIKFKDGETIYTLEDSEKNTIEVNDAKELTPITETVIEVKAIPITREVVEEDKKSDIEAQKADIKRRNKEDLDKNKIKYGKYNLKVDAIEATLVERLTGGFAVVVALENKDSSTGFLNSEVLTQEFETRKEAIDYINETIIPIAEQKINAKYAKELATLGTTNTGLDNIESFETSKGSIYRVLPNGKTQRFKTATNELNEPNDLIVFVKFKSTDQEQDFLSAQNRQNGQKLYVVDTKGNTYDTNVQVKGKDVKLAIVKDGKVIETVETSLEPKIGYNTFDQRRYVDKGESYRSTHLGNEVTKINYKKSVDAKLAKLEGKTIEESRAEEQKELNKAIPNIEKYKVNGKIEKSLMPREDLVKYQKIYNKYDKIITPLLKEKLKKQIEALPDDMIFGAHVTEDEVAQKIYETQFKFNLGTALQGTIGIVSKEGLLNLMNNLLDGNSPHRNQFGVFILAWPKSEFGTNSLEKKVNLDTIENQMIDTYPEFLGGNIPTKFNYGYFKYGELFTKETLGTETSLELGYSDPDLQNIDPILIAARNGDKEAQQKFEDYGLDWRQTTTYRFVGKLEVDVLLSNNKVESKRGMADNGIDVTSSPKVTTAATGEYRVTFKESFDKNNRLGKVRKKNEEDSNLERGRGYTLDDVAKIERLDENGNVVEVVYDAKSAPAKLETQENIVGDSQQLVNNLRNIKQFINESKDIMKDMDSVFEVIKKEDYENWKKSLDSTNLNDEIESLSPPWNDKASNSDIIKYLLNRYINTQLDLIGNSAIKEIEEDYTSTEEEIIVRLDTDSWIQVFDPGITSLKEKEDYIKLIVNRITNESLKGLKYEFETDEERQFYESNKQEIDAEVTLKLNEVATLNIIEEKENDFLANKVSFLNAFNKLLSISPVDKTKKENIESILDSIKGSVSMFLNSWTLSKAKKITFDLKSIYSKLNKNYKDKQTGKLKVELNKGVLLNPSIKKAYDNYDLFPHQHTLHLEATKDNEELIVNKLMDFVSKNDVYITFSNFNNLAEVDSIRIYSKDSKLSTQVMDNLISDIASIITPEINNPIISDFVYEKLPSNEEFVDFINSLDPSIKEEILNYLDIPASERGFISNPKKSYKNGLSLASYKAVKVFVKEYDDFIKTNKVNNKSILTSLITHQLKSIDIYGEANALYNDLLYASEFSNVRKTKYFKDVLDLIKTKINSLEVFSFANKTLSIGETIFDNKGNEFTILSYTISNKKSKEKTSVFKVLVIKDNSTQQIEIITQEEYKTSFSTGMYKDEEKFDYGLGLLPFSLLGTISNDIDIFFVQSGINRERRDEVDQNAAVSRLVIERLRQEEATNINLKVETPTYDDPNSPFYIEPGQRNPNVPERIEEIFLTKLDGKKFSELNEEELKDIKQYFGKIATLIDNRGSYIKYDRNGKNDPKGIIPLFFIPKGELKIEGDIISYGSRILIPITERVINSKGSITEEEIIKEAEREAKELDRIHATVEPQIVPVDFISKGVIDREDYITYKQVEKFDKESQLKFVMSETKGEKGTIKMELNNTSITLAEKAIGEEMALAILAYLGVEEEYFLSKAVKLSPEMKSRFKELTKKVNAAKEKGSIREAYDLKKQYVDFLNRVLFLSDKNFQVLFDTYFMVHSVPEIFDAINVMDYSKVEEGVPRNFPINNTWKRMPMNKDKDILEYYAYLDTIVNLISKINFDTSPDFVKSDYNDNFVTTDNTLSIASVKVKEYLMDKYYVFGLVVNESLLSAKNRYLHLEPRTAPAPRELTDEEDLEKQIEDMRNRDLENNVATLKITNFLSNSQKTSPENKDLEASDDYKASTLKSIRSILKNVNKSLTEDDSKQLKKDMKKAKTKQEVDNLKNDTLEKYNCKI